MERNFLLTQVKIFPVGLEERKSNVLRTFDFSFRNDAITGENLLVLRFELSNVIISIVDIYVNKN